MPPEKCASCGGARFKESKELSQGWRTFTLVGTIAFAVGGTSALRAVDPQAGMGKSILIGAALGAGGGLLFGLIAAAFGKKIAVYKCTACNLKST